VALGKLAGEPRYTTFQEKLTDTESLIRTTSLLGGDGSAEGSKTLLT